MAVESNARFYVADSLSNAIAALSERGREGAPLAGATWIMRAPLRGEREDLSYVAIAKLDELRAVSIGEREISVGACATHAAVARALAPLSAWRALACAAGNSANPAVREVATVGGNLCATGFAASDLAPALMCLDALVEIETSTATDRISIERFLEARTDLLPGWLVRRVVIPRTAARSAHIRLPLRKAGDYPVAIVSIAATVNADGIVSDAKVAVGSVEQTARRWTNLENGLIGRPLDAHAAAEAAENYSGDFTGRDGVEAPGWYRVKVLPSLLRKAVHDLQS